MKQNAFMLFASDWHTNQHKLTISLITARRFRETQLARRLKETQLYYVYKLCT